MFYVFSFSAWSLFFFFVFLLFFYVKFFVCLVICIPSQVRRAVHEECVNPSSALLVRQCVIQVHVALPVNLLLLSVMSCVEILRVIGNVKGRTNIPDIHIGKQSEESKRFQFTFCFVFLSVTLLLPSFSLYFRRFVLFFFVSFFSLCICTCRPEFCPVPRCELICKKPTCTDGETRPQACCPCTHVCCCCRRLLLYHIVV